MARHLVGIAGLGVVGGGVAGIITANSAAISQRTGAEIVLARAAEKDPAKAAASLLAQGVITDDAERLLEDESIETVVELMGGTAYAHEFTMKAIAAGKNVVTANKALLASSGAEMMRAARKMGVAFGFEAAVGGGIPVIRTLREAYAGDNVKCMIGILNGTCNYILTRMSRDGVAFESALKDAQSRGYAEADPSLDISGKDSAHKLVILARLAFGGDFPLEGVYCEGISGLETADIRYAAELGYRIKLLAIAKRSDEAVELRVHPCLISARHPLGSVEGVFNSVFIDCEYVGETMLYGQGAGRHPTASAVVGDLIDVAVGRAHTFEYVETSTSSDLRPMTQTVCRYYLRFQALDRPGVLAQLAGVLGKHDISIAQVIQKGRRHLRAVPLVILTHEAREGAVQKALAEISRLDVIGGPGALVRLVHEE